MLYLQRNPSSRPCAVIGVLTTRNRWPLAPATFVGTLTWQQTLDRSKMVMGWNAREAVGAGDIRREKEKGLRRQAPSRPDQEVSGSRYYGFAVDLRALIDQR